MCAVTLDAYLKKHDLSDADFAAKAGLHRVEVWNYRTGRRQPRAQNIVAIEKATSGKVRAADFAGV